MIHFILYYIFLSNSDQWIWPEKWVTRTKRKAPILKTQMGRMYSVFLNYQLFIILHEFLGIGGILLYLLQRRKFFHFLTNYFW